MTLSVVGQVISFDFNFTGFMDALTAPRAYKKPENASQNKMRGLGIEESDSKGHSDSMPAHHREVPKPRGKRFGRSTLNTRIYRLVFFFSEEMKFNPITVELLRQEKGYQKVLRKQQKELESLKKRHQKEKLAVQKQHCAAIEKIIKGKKYEQFLALPGTFGREIQLPSFSLFLVSIAKRNFRETRLFVARFPNKLFNGLDWRIGNDARNVTWYVLIWRNDGIACENYAWLLKWPSKSNLLHDTSARSKR